MHDVLRTNSTKQYLAENNYIADFDALRSFNTRIHLNRNVFEHVNISEKPATGSMYSNLGGTVTFKDTASELLSPTSSTSSISSTSMNTTTTILTITLGDANSATTGAGNREGAVSQSNANKVISSNSVLPTNGPENGRGLTLNRKKFTISFHFRYGGKYSIM